MTEPFQNIKDETQSKIMGSIKKDSPMGKHLQSLLDDPDIKNGLVQCVAKTGGSLDSGMHPVTTTSNKQSIEGGDITFNGYGDVGDGHFANVNISCQRPKDSSRDH